MVRLQMENTGDVEVVIITNWKPRYPREGDKPYGAVVYLPKFESYLRFGGNRELVWGGGLFWDCYPEDFETVANAAAALLVAPQCPGKPYVTFTLQAPKKVTE